MTKQHGGGFVMRDSVRGKKSKEKVTIQEEKRREGLIERIRKT